ncbi:MAG: DinB family protein [Acidimicrobiales bacterium]|jgi:uncharacterized damage-inducible protein DinB
MTSAGVLADALNRVKESLHHALEGLSEEELSVRLDRDANSICWLAWHLTRVQDDHVSAVSGADQVYLTGGWADRFALPMDVHETGYGHSSEQVGLVRSDSETLLGYYDEVHEQTLRFIDSLTDDDLDRVVDDHWDPPVTLGVRLVSVINDDTQHVGQAAILRGIIERR